MFCEKCGTQPDEGGNCPQCGVQAEKKEPVAPKTKFSWEAIVGFVVSLVGTFMPEVGALICGIVGIVFSALGMGKTKKPNVKGRGLAIAGLVLAIIAAVYGLFNSVYYYGYY